MIPSFLWPPRISEQNLVTVKTVYYTLLYALLFPNLFYFLLKIFNYLYLFLLASTKFFVEGGKYIHRYLYIKKKINGGRYRLRT